MDELIKSLYELSKILDSKVEEVRGKLADPHSAFPELSNDNLWINSTIQEKYGMYVEFWGNLLAYEWKLVELEGKLEKVFRSWERIQHRRLEWTMRH